ncbi:hypothetical protein BgiMline_022440 [Biomphalaria glabrata]|nr:hypothetical protein BgiMline_010292 [Biomphalaria glabrata]
MIVYIKQPFHIDSFNIVGRYKRNLRSSVVIEKICMFTYTEDTSVAYQRVSTGSVCTQEKECCLPESLNRERLYPGHKSVAYQRVSTGSVCTQEKECCLPESLNRERLYPGKRVLLTRESQQGASAPRTRVLLTRESQQGASVPRKKSVAYQRVSTGSVCTQEKECCLPESLNRERLYPGKRVLLTRESQQGASVPRKKSVAYQRVSTGSVCTQEKECCLPESLNRERLYPGKRVLLTRESQQGASVPRKKSVAYQRVSTGSVCTQEKECCLPESLNRERLHLGHECCLPESLNRERLYPGKRVLLTRESQQGASVPRKKSVAYQRVSTGSVCTQDTRVLLTRESFQGASVPRTQECCLPGSLNREHLYPGHKSVAYQGVSTGNVCTQDTRVLLTRESQHGTSVPRTQECCLPRSLDRKLTSVLLCTQDQRFTTRPIHV